MGKGFISTPSWAIAVCATLSLTPGRSFNRSAAPQKGASADFSRASNSAIVALICSIVFRC